MLQNLAKAVLFFFGNRSLFRRWLRLVMNSNDLTRYPFWCTRSSHMAASVEKLILVFLFSFLAVHIYPCFEAKFYARSVITTRGVVDRRSEESSWNVGSFVIPLATAAVFVEKGKGLCLPRFFLTVIADGAFERCCFFRNPSQLFERSTCA